MKRNALKTKRLSIQSHSSRFLAQTIKVIPNP